jgi:acetylornithine deacetylase/succinyl-diaminopimelate desuccinylase-like protein
MIGQQLLSLGAILIGLQSRPAWAHPDQVDWEAAGQETVQLLSEYLQIDTVNPPGNENRGALFLQEKLTAQGIPSLIVESAPGRGNLIARLEGTGELPPLCLLSHIDVVPSEEANWPADKQPLSGVIDEDGMIWGRGALDMKSMGAIQLQSMLLLARQEVALKRDIVLLAVADEEVDNTGIQLIAREYWDRIGCSHVLNEGGMGLDDLFFDGQRAYAISVGEKGVLWLKMIASGDPGHGSTPRPDEAPDRLLQALKAIEDREDQASIHPAMLEMLQIAGQDEGGLMGFILGHPRFFKPLIMANMTSDPITRAAITDTVHLTGLGGANKPNVIPGEVYALLDCRLLPGTEPEALIVELEALVNDPEVRFEVLSSEPAAVSEWHEDPVYEALARNAVRGQDNAIAGPVISVGFTDSIYLRPLGVRAYGLAPFGTDQEGLRSMHGNGEHIASSEVQRGLEILYRTLWEVSALPDGVE